MTPSVPPPVNQPPSESRAGGKAREENPRPATRIRFESIPRPPAHSFNNATKHPLRTILETLGGGVAVLDFDRDGWQDVCFAGGGDHDDDRVTGSPMRLFRNGTELDAGWIDMSDGAGFRADQLFSLGVAAGDFNNDGFTDLCVTGYGTVKLLRNQGDGTFSECSAEAGLTDSGFSTGAAWCDLNSDGALDMYICHYLEWDRLLDRQCLLQRKSPQDICGPKSFRAESDRVYFGDGHGGFTDESTAAGLADGGKGLGVVAGDVDRDGDIDLYVANDTTANFLYLNDGTGRLEEVAALHGVAYDENGRVTGSMGVSMVDQDDDGRFDLWTTNFEYEALALYRNMDHAQFHLISRPAGVTSMHGEYVSWGTAFADFDRDGDLDVVVANGHLPDYVPEERLRQIPFLLEKDGQRFTWVRSPPESYFESRHSGRGLAVADFDRDGRVDLVITHLQEPISILRNTTPGPGASLHVRLIGRTSNRDALGTVASLDTAYGTQLRCLAGGGSYLSTSENCVEWNYPEGTTPRRLTITWPSGKVQTHEQFPVPQPGSNVSRLVILEPE